jgi:hypothetical protein
VDDFRLFLLLQSVMDTVGRLIIRQIVHVFEKLRALTGNRCRGQRGGNRAGRRRGNAEDSRFPPGVFRPVRPEDDKRSASDDRQVTSEARGLFPPSQGV